MTTSTNACPCCGGSLTLDAHARVDVPTFSQASRTIELCARPACVVFCDVCEFSLAVDLPTLSLSVEELAASSPDRSWS